MAEAASRAFSPTPHASKQDIRRELRIRRATRATDPGATAAVAEGLARTLAASTLMPAAATTVTAYLSRPGEPGTGPLRSLLAEWGVRVLLPWLLDDRGLDWVMDPGPVGPATGPSESSAAVPGSLRPPGARLGPAAVADAVLLLVPALAVDTAGRRLGQGGGSYDRVLAALPTRAQRPLVVACVHDEEVLDAATDPLPEEPHDRRVDAALTPTRTLMFGVDGGPDGSGGASR
jgi:5-formyltetrahydrofolate cyclo-ligase